MEPRLVCVDGFLKGEVFPLTGEDLSLGRDASNRVRIIDRSVSRHHCVLKGAEGLYRICDLDSRNGTFVNNVPVRERTLEHGDRIKIGSADFVFLLHPAEADTGVAVQFEETTIDDLTTVQLRCEDAVYLQPDRLLAALPIAGQMARDLHALLKISTTINSIRGAENLKEKLLDLIFEIVPAERGAILMVAPGGEEVASVSGHLRDSASAQPVRVSRTILQRVLREGVAVLKTRGPEGDPFESLEGLVVSGTQSVLC